MLYEKDNIIYLYEDNRYYVADIIVTYPTIAIYKTSQYVETLENAKEVTFEYVKRKAINGNNI